MDGFDTGVLLPGILQTGAGFSKAGFRLPKARLLLAVFKAHDEVSGCYRIVHIKRQLDHRTAGLGRHRALLNRFDQPVKVYGFIERRPGYRRGLEILCRSCDGKE